MTFTKEQRNTIYCILLAEAEQPSHHLHEVFNECRLSTENGLCFMLKLLFSGGYWYYGMNTLLPELYNRKPLSKGDRGWWFPCNKKGWEERKKILKECIEETL